MAKETRLLLIILLISHHLPLSLPMLLQPNEEQHSNTKSSPTATNQTHSYREERTFIKSLYHDHICNTIITLSAVSLAQVNSISVNPIHLKP